MFAATGKAIDFERTLTVGCGRRLFSRRGVRTDIDPSVGQGMANFLRADTQSLPFKDNSFDCVLSSHVLEHLTQEGCRNALAEQHRVVVNGGMVAAVVPDVRWTAGRDPTHLREYTQEEFCSIFESTVSPRGTLRLVGAGQARSHYSFYVIWQKEGKL